MKTVGIICEYNPFHRGHAEQIERVRAEYGDCTIVCLMSGSFVQRGEAAIYPKALRAQIAVEMGADLVIELPYPFSASGAESFARAGVSILASMGVQVLCFGSESGDLAALSRLAERMDSPAFVRALEEDEGGESESYVRRCQRIYQTLYHAPFPTAPNDILAVCYLRAINRLECGMEPFTYRRSSPFSAGQARDAIRAGDRDAMLAQIPDKALDRIGQTPPTPPLLPAAHLLAFFRLYPRDVETLCRMDGMSPGLPSRIRSAAMECTDSETLLARLTSKRDTLARMKRGLIACLLSTKREMPLQDPAFTLLLGASKKGCALLASLRRAPDCIPILTRPSAGRQLEGEAREQFDHALRAEYLYATMAGTPAADVLRRTPFVKQENAD